MRRAMALFITLLMLCSCSAFRNEASVENFLGESVIADHGTEHECVMSVKKILACIAPNGMELYPFSDPRAVAELYRDRILSYLVSTGYSKYTGNSAKITEAEKKYPKMRISVLVPQSDVEYLVYSNFGGGKSISHESGTVFTHLTKVDGYTAVGVVNYSAAEIEIANIKETENTYIVSFYTYYSGVYSPLYRGVFVKREDGSVYLGKLERIADAKITVPEGVDKQEETE